MNWQVNESQCQSWFWGAIMLETNTFRKQSFEYKHYTKKRNSKLSITNNPSYTSEVAGCQVNQHKSAVLSLKWVLIYKCDT